MVQLFLGHYTSASSRKGRSEDLFRRLKRAFRNGCSSIQTSSQEGLRCFFLLPHLISTRTRSVCSRTPVTHLFGGAVYVKRLLPGYDCRVGRYCVIIIARIYYVLDQCRPGHCDSCRRDRKSV